VLVAVTVSVLGGFGVADYYHYTYTYVCIAYLVLFTVVAVISRNVLRSRGAGVSPASVTHIA